jgi:dihydroorotase-like cyclic amidohydrolase
MFYLNKHTPYDGKTWKGYIESTWVRGTKVYEGGKILAEPGFGKFCPMIMDAE